MSGGPHPLHVSDEEWNRWEAERLAGAQQRRAVAPRERKRLRLFTAEDLLALPEPKWLIEGIIPAGSLAVLFGDSSAGKTFVALDWALSIASGTSWLGHAVRQGPVVYVVAEGGRGLGIRYRAWIQDRGRPDTSAAGFVTEAINLRDCADVERLRTDVLSLLDGPPALLVIDTLARCMVGGDENSARDVGEFVAAVDDLRGDRAALVVHHTGKDRGAARGSSALRGAADVMVKVVRNGTTVKLKCDKPPKDGPEFDAISLNMAPVAGSLALRRGDAPRVAHDDLATEVLRVIAEHGPISQNGVTGKIRRRREDVLAAVKAHEAAGTVIRTSKGFEVVADRPEPPGNHLSGGPDGGGSREGVNPVGVPSEEPPRPPAAVMGPWGPERGDQR